MIARSKEGLALIVGLDDIEPSSSARKGGKLNAGLPVGQTASNAEGSRPAPSTARTSVRRV